MMKYMVRSMSTLWPVLALFLITGCAPKSQDVGGFVWPSPPEQPRIRFLESFEGPEDLKKKSFFDVLFGAPVHRFSRPSTVSVDAAGRIYIADSARVVVLNKQTGETDYIGAPGMFTNITGIAVAPDGSTIYVADNRADRVLGVDRAGKVKVAIGTGELLNPIGVAIDPKRGRLYVTDGKKNQVLAYDLQGKQLFTIGAAGEEKGNFNIPFDVALNSEGNVYVSDMGNFRVQIFSPDGKFLSSFGQIGDRPGFFQRPKGIAIDRHDHVYVVDNVFNVVQMYDKNNNLLLAWGQGGYGAGEMMNAIDIHVDDKDRIYLVSQMGRRLNVYQLLTYE